MSLSHTEEELVPRGWGCGVMLVGEAAYCTRVNSLEAYGDVNRYTFGNSCLHASSCGLCLGGLRSRLNPPCSSKCPLLQRAR